MTDSAPGRVGEALRLAHAGQGTINAFTFIDDRAVDRATTLDLEISRGGRPGPLHGLPVGLKDLIDQQGLVTTAGSAFYRKEATRSAPVVDRLEGAGAVIIGRTGLHEWAFGFSSENPHFGPVRNPWDPNSSAGGSSGGSAAAIAAGITPLGIGTDTGGSIRVPAALCGCYGLKTTYGSVPMAGVVPLVASIDTIGPLADSMSLLQRAYRVMTLTKAPANSLVGRLKIGVPQPWVDDSPSSSQVAAGFQTALDSLTGLGHEVVVVDAPMLRPPGQIWEAIAKEVLSVHTGYLDAGERYGDDVAARLAEARMVTAEETAAARIWQDELRGAMGEIFHRVDLLATPTVPVTKKVIGQERIDGRHYRTVLSWFTAMVNHARCPALAMPIAGTGRPPVSLQIVGPMGSDTKLLSFGRSLELEGLVGFRGAQAELPSL